MNLSSQAELPKCPCDQHIQMLVFHRIAKVGVLAHLYFLYLLLFHNLLYIKPLKLS